MLLLSLSRLPSEIWTLIFKELAATNSLGTLFCCIQVNRLWCILAIPYLWCRPFSSIRDFSSLHYRDHFLKIIDVLFHFLPEEEKVRIILDECEPLVFIRYPTFPY